jgi:hypothetical protein
MKKQFKVTHEQHRTLGSSGTGVLVGSWKIGRLEGGLLVRGGARGDHPPAPPRGCGRAPRLRRRVGRRKHEQRARSPHPRGRGRGPRAPEGPAPGRPERNHADSCKRVGTPQALARARRLVLPAAAHRPVHRCHGNLHGRGRCASRAGLTICPRPRCGVAVARARSSCTCAVVCTVLAVSLRTPSPFPAPPLASQASPHVISCLSPRTAGSLPYCCRRRGIAPVGQTFCSASVAVYRGVALVCCSRPEMAARCPLFRSLLPRLLQGRQGGAHCAPQLPGSL